MGIDDVNCLIRADPASERAEQKRSKTNRISMANSVLKTIQKEKTHAAASNFCSSKRLPVRVPNALFLRTVGGSVLPQLRPPDAQSEQIKSDQHQKERRVAGMIHDKTAHLITRQPCHRPGRQHHTVDFAFILQPVDVRQIGRQTADFSP